MPIDIWEKHAPDKVAARVAYIVFLLPVALSLTFGGTVLGQVLQEPDRDLNLWQFGRAVTSSSTSIEIFGLERQYSASESIDVIISVTDNSFDCGDLYITIYHAATGEVVTQSGFFNQCFVQDNSALPVGDAFSEQITEPGDYEVRAEINDGSDSIFTTGVFSVR